MTNGYIQFSFLGGREAKRGLLQSTQDENSVVFNKRQQSAFDEIKSQIDRIRGAFDRGVADVPVSELDEIEKLASLKSRGIITEEEFQAKKAQLLGL